MTESLLCRLQSLTEPSREMDGEIALAFGRTKTGMDGALRWYIDVNGESTSYPPRYTASIDAALTLWDGCVWSVSRFSDAYQASVSVYSGSGATPAIALLIAIMREEQEKIND